jgi:long-subunit acyl-CoA synthetase (AMP-forming)
MRTTLRSIRDYLLTRKSPIATVFGDSIVGKTSRDLAEDVTKAAALLRSWGVCAGMRVGLLAENCYEWIVFDLAIIELDCISVALPESDVPIVERHIAMRWELNLILVSPRFAPSDIAAQPYVAYMTGQNPPNRRVIEALPTRHAALPDDHTYVFGSGSSGARKGMIATRSGIEAIAAEFAEAFQVNANDSILVFMPLSILQQRLFCYGALLLGVGLYITEPTQVFRAIRDLAPTILVAPPLFYDGVRERDLARLFGPATRVLIMGMAKPRRSTLNYFTNCGLPLYEAYALNECGLVAANTNSASCMGSVGKPLPGTEVRIAEDGEIEVRKLHMLTRGYFFHPTAPPVQWEPYSWWPTGDIGYLDAAGYLYVEGRKDDLLVLPSGHKLQPLSIEQVFEEESLIQRAVIFQDPHSPTLTLVVDTNLRAEPDIMKRLRSLVIQVNETLPEWCHIGLIQVAPEPFTPQNRLLTPNFKLNRFKIREAFLHSVSLT